MGIDERTIYGLCQKEETMIAGLWIFFYLYLIYQVGRITKGLVKIGVTIILTMGIYSFFVWMNIRVLGGLAVILIMGLYDLFFDDEPFSNQYFAVLSGGIPLLARSLFDANVVLYDQLLFLITFGLFFVILWRKRQQHNWLSFLGVLVGNGCLIGILLFLEYQSIQRIVQPLYGLMTWGVVIFGFIFFFVQERTLWKYQKGYLFKTNRFQEQLLTQQYEEIQAVYLNMRGFKHDYHNHMQVLKAQMDMGDVGKARNYLDELEQELKRVDSYVKSGNSLLDAMLNSKLSIAENHQIQIDCKANIEEEISIQDIDLCIILGNLLDNSMEACNQVEESKRFLRIYIVRIQEQLYISIQNSAKEDLDFEEQNYISKKRGNHGLGMKRVKAIVDKYGGYMRLSNESGIFGTEITIPLTQIIKKDAIRESI